MQSVLQALGRRLDPAARAPVAVAFSGGGDFTALLLLAKAWADRHGRRLIAFNVDHRLQPQSGDWAAEAARLAARIGADFVALSWDGPKPSTGLPAAARAARHRLIAEAARAAGCTAILLGHTFDDALENALMIAAGEPSGALREWSPSPVWPEGRGLFHLRPLLAVRRAELRAWLRRQGVGWIDDPANDDLRYGRARARARLQGGETAPPLDPSGEDAALAALAQGARALDWGGMVLPREALVGGGPAALRLLQIAIAVASGRQALGRPERAGTVLARLAAGERFVAGLGGARLVAGNELLIARESGEYARAGCAEMPLAAGKPAVWDGRVELTAASDGLIVRPLRGLASRLQEPERARLYQIPAAARGALPVIVEPSGRVSGPILAASASGAGQARLRGLTAERFAAACGLIEREGATSGIGRMAN